MKIPNRENLYTILERTAQDRPDSEAVVCGDERYSYAQLKERVDRLAQGLCSLGIRKNDRLAIILKNCHFYLESYFAAAKIGAELVPLNYRLAAQDFIYILNDAGARGLIARPELIRCLSGRKGALHALEKVILTSPSREGSWPETILYQDLIDNSRQADAAVAIEDASSIAQIYYTSGTTGRPKGVILTHRNNLAHADRAIEELRLSPQDKWLHVSPMFHLADAWAVWAVTKAGGTHVMTPGFEPASVLEAVEKHGVTLSNFIPTMLNILVNSPEVHGHDLSSLRLIMSGGAPIAKEVVRKIIEIFRCDYVQTYGLTETSPFLTMSILTEDLRRLPFEERLKHMVTTGRPFKKVQIKVVKEDGSEVARDNREVGEIIAKSETITPGYWNLPGETSQRIIDGWLYTRDMAVVNAEGYITIVDRKDDAILTGGEIVYSIEIEDMLYSHPDVLEAAVIGLPDPIWGEIVTAVIVPKPDRELNEEAVIQFSKKRLAGFKTPKKVIFTGHLPKTGSAKIYKYKLREKYGPDQSG